MGTGVFLRDVNKGRTQDGSGQEPRRAELRSVCRGLEQRQGPAGFSARAHDVGSGAFAVVQEGQLPKCFSARLKMSARACY